MRFIRVNGRIVPIKDNNSAPSSVKAKSGDIYDKVSHDKGRKAKTADKVKNAAFAGTMAGALGGALGALMIGKKAALIGGSAGAIFGAYRGSKIKKVANHKAGAKAANEYLKSKGYSAKGGW